MQWNTGTRADPNSRSPPLKRWATRRVGTRAFNVDPSLCGRVIDPSSRTAQQQAASDEQHREQNPRQSRGVAELIVLEGALIEIKHVKEQAVALGVMAQEIRLVKGLQANKPGEAVWREGGSNTRGGVDGLV